MASPPPSRLAMVGISTQEICGVRDHGTVLAAELAARGVDCQTHWLTRRELGLAARRRELDAWATQLEQRLRRERPQGVILQYSVFEYSHRGVPIYVPRVLGALRSAGAPVLCLIHEAVYPWRLGGLRGKVWAASQRLAMIEVMRACAAALVTADFRAQWLSSRAWLPQRPVAMAPVYSNLPAPREGAELARTGERLGLFGYAYEGADFALALDALQRVRRSHGGVRLALLGSPGGESPAAAAWREAAATRGLAQALSFTGTLAPQELSDALAACDVLLSIAGAGPSSRKGTFAAALASGAPVVALDGPLRWQELVAAEALRIVPRTPAAMAQAIEELLEDPVGARELGRRGRAFAEQRMGVARTVDTIFALLGSLGGWEGIAGGQGGRGG